MPGPHPVDSAVRPAIDEYFLDPRVVRRSFDRASLTYDRSAGVQAEIRTRLLERLDIVRLEPQRVLDLGAGTGDSARSLQRRYRSAQVLALDLSTSMLRQSRRPLPLLRRFERVAADAHRLPLPDGSIDLVFSNLMLEWCHDPDLVFREIRRVLRPGGLLTFTTLGPDTLKELRALWRQVDGHPHVHRFIDMHDLGDALVRSGLAEPVMDTERLTVTYPDLATLVRELRDSGSANVAAGRARGLSGRARWNALQQLSETLKRNGALPVSVEVVYGHAWAGAARERRSDNAEVRVPVGSIRRRN
jgi:malonyl-CoA O-methyltransferase